MRARIVACLVLSLALGCAAQYEEPAGTQPDAAREQASPTEVAMEPAAAADEPPERTLDDIQLELASNEAKLRALGVELPPRAVAGGDANLGGGETAERAPEPEGSGGSGATATAVERPSTAPAPEPKPMAPGKSTDSNSSTKQGRKDKPAKKKIDDADIDARFAQPPEEAKAAPLSPTEQPKLDAATRCIQVCELSEITCELGVQICGLAQRHAGDEDYEQACARATDDCDAAQEACDACAG